MDASHLFTAALRLRSPWRVGSADFRDADGDGREPHITIGFEPGRGFMLLFEAWVWLYRLCSWMMHSRLEPMKELARLFRRHFATRPVGRRCRDIHSRRGYPARLGFSARNAPPGLLRPDISPRPPAGQATAAQRQDRARTYAAVRLSGPWCRHVFRQVVALNDLA